MMLTTHNSEISNNVDEDLVNLIRMSNIKNQSMGCVVGEKVAFLVNKRAKRYEVGCSGNETVTQSFAKQKVRRETLSWRDIYVQLNIAQY